MIDLDGVRRGDAHLSRARRLLQGAQPRTIPLDTIDTTKREEPMKDKLVFTSDEAAELLGVHPQTLRKWIRNGDLKAVSVGRSYRIDRAQLESFWRAQGGERLFDATDTDQGATMSDTTEKLTAEIVDAIRNCTDSGETEARIKAAFEAALVAGNIESVADAALNIIGVKIEEADDE